MQGCADGLYPICTTSMQLPRVKREVIIWDPLGSNDYDFNSLHATSTRYRNTTRIQINPIQNAEIARQPHRFDSGKTIEKKNCIYLLIASSCIVLRNAQTTTGRRLCAFEARKRLGNLEILMKTSSQLSWSSTPNLISRQKSKAYPLRRRRPNTCAKTFSAHESKPASFALKLPEATE